MISALPPDSDTERHWTMNDEIHGHHFGRIPGPPGTVTLRLDWKRTGDSESQEIGRFSLDLKALLGAGYVREVDDGVILRFQRTGKAIEVTVNRGEPATKVADIGNRA